MGVRACVCAGMLIRTHSDSISFVNECARLCVCVCVCVPIPFHLIKPWLQQPHTLVCRTQPFITGLEPFTAGFMGASASPQGHHSRGKEEEVGMGNEEVGRGGGQRMDDKRTERRDDKGRG